MGEYKQWYQRRVREMRKRSQSIRGSAPPPNGSQNGRGRKMTGLDPKTIKRMQTLREIIAQQIALHCNVVVPTEMTSSLAEDYEDLVDSAPCSSTENAEQEKLALDMEKFRYKI
eukprot:TRINITY_DN1821_c0_g1_i3.p1 TRINITY_DN1821_c0_g1~~TRINITY_DN1821_c0_g1_i3.p1  ORF type:complete len:114 (-),score=27.20 TRINITY_DN1821_c0_g1_i3:562-903(-)